MMTIIKAGLVSHLSRVTEVRFRIAAVADRTLQIKNIFGSDRSPRRGNVGSVCVCVCVCALYAFRLKERAQREGLKKGPKKKA